MEFFVIIALGTIVFSILQMIWFILELTINVCRDDFNFAVKTLTSGFASSIMGYIIDGRVTIEVVLWGIGGLVLYLTYRYIFSPP